MDFELNAKTVEHRERVQAFMDQHIYPLEQEHHA